MSSRATPRPLWDDLPRALRSAVEQVLGARVVASTSSAGGWSPGSADLVVLEDGRRAFVKAVDARVNGHAADLHRREVEVLGLLAGRSAPRLLGVVDAPPWIALAVEAITGRHPDPGSARDTASVLDAVEAFPPADVLPDARPVEEELADASLGWSRLTDDGAPLPDGIGALLEPLDTLARRLPEAVHGSCVVHGDLRVDNVLVDGAGRGRIVDWPWALAGARWFDGVTYLLDVRHLGGDVRSGLDHPLIAAAPPGDVDVLLAVLGAYFLDSARGPEVPGLGGLRAYQLAQGRTAVAWLRERRPDLR